MPPPFSPPTHHSCRVVCFYCLVAGQCLWHERTRAPSVVNIHTYADEGSRGLLTVFQFSISGLKEENILVCMKNPIFIFRSKLCKNSIVFGMPHYFSNFSKYHPSSGVGIATYIYTWLTRSLLFSNPPNTNGCSWAAGRNVTISNRWFTTGSGANVFHVSFAGV